MKQPRTHSRKGQAMSETKYKDVTNAELRMRVEGLNLSNGVRVVSLSSEIREVLDRMDAQSTALREENEQVRGDFVHAMNTLADVPDITISGNRVDGTLEITNTANAKLAKLEARVKPLEALLDGYETPLIVTYDQNNDFLMVRDSGAREIGVADITAAINAFATHAPAQSGEGGR
jgi:hypothetical protein